MEKRIKTQQSKQVLRFLFLFTVISFYKPLLGQVKPGIAITSLSKEVAPFDTVRLVCTVTGNISVSDAKGTIYKKMPAAASVAFVAGGAAGTQKICSHKCKGQHSSYYSVYFKGSN